MSLPVQPKNINSEEMNALFRKTIKTYPIVVVCSSDLNIRNELYPATEISQSKYDKPRYRSHDRLDHNQKQDTSDLSCNVANIMH